MISHSAFTTHKPERDPPAFLYPLGKGWHRGTKGEDESRKTEEKEDTGMGSSVLTLASTRNYMSIVSVPDVSGSRENSPCTVTMHLRFSSIFLFNKYVVSPWNMVGRALVWRRLSRRPRQADR